MNALWIDLHFHHHEWSEEIPVGAVKWESLKSFIQQGVFQCKTRLTLHQFGLRYVVKYELWCVVCCSMHANTHKARRSTIWNAIQNHFSSLSIFLSNLKVFHRCSLCWRWWISGMANAASINQTLLGSWWKFLLCERKMENSRWNINKSRNQTSCLNKFIDLLFTLQY